MRLRKRAGALQRILWVLSIGLSMTAWAQQEAPTPSPNAEAKADKESGVSADVKIKAQTKDPFRYEPINPEFWESVNRSLSIGNYIKVVTSASQYLKEVKGQVDDEGEARLALAIGLEKLGFTYGASTLFEELTRKRLGTLVGLEALRGLDRLAQSTFYDRQDIGDDLLNNTEFGPLPPDVQSFVSFHVGLFDLTQGFKKWSENELGQINKDSFWNYQFEYLKALGEVARDRIDQSLDRLQKVSDATAGKFLSLNEQARLQIARILFEKGEYQKAYDIYRSLQSLSVRELARVTVEKAWCLFYLRDFSKALGELTFLNTPQMKDLVPYETYVLKMLIYKELCHYESSFATAAAFRENYRSALDDIRKRRLLKNSPGITRQTLLNRRYQYWANYINVLQEELKNLREFRFESLEFYRPMLELYRLKEAEIKNRIEQDLENASRETANTLLDIEEQVAFLEYASRLDSLRIANKDEDRRYESEKISYLKFDKIFWPIESEYWSDEFPDYKVLIQSRCDRYESAVAPGSNDRGGEFK